MCACAEVIGALSRCCLGAEMFLHARAFIPRLSVQCLFQCACGRIEDKSCRSDVKRVLNNHLIIIHAHNEHTWSTVWNIYRYASFRGGRNQPQINQKWENTTLVVKIPLWTVTAFASVPARANLPPSPRKYPARGLGGSFQQKKEIGHAETC